MYETFCDNPSNSYCILSKTTNVNLRVLLKNKPLFISVHLFMAIHLKTVILFWTKVLDKATNITTPRATSIGSLIRAIVCFVLFSTKIEAEYLHTEL